MGLMELIKCALICTDFLGWPVIALGYPLFASIRAVESGSKYQLRKLAIYWILFALISLFEFSFLKIIQWIPLWSRIKLVAIFWMVMPRFDGACQAYQSLVRPVLFGNVEAVMDKFHKLKEEKPRKRETFVDVAEECIKANVCEASEKVAGSKHECTNSQRDIQVIELESKNAEELSKQAKVAAWVTKVTEAAAAEVKEMTPQESNAKNKHPETPPLEKAQQQIEWSCDLCKMTTTNEKTLNAHLQGRKHKSNCESLKAIKLGAENTGPSLSTIGKLNPSNVETNAAAVAGEVKKTPPLKASVENSRPETPPIKKVLQQWACDLCKVRTCSEKTPNDHLQGSKHKFNCESLKANELSAKDTGPSPLAKGKLNKGNVNFGAISEETKVIEASAKNSCPETPPTKKVQQEWNCNVCMVKTTSEKMLNDHLQGSRHKINYESLKVGELIAKDTSPSSSATCKLNQGSEDFGLCAKDTTPTEARAKNSCPETPPTKKVQQKWTCDLCKVEMTSEKTLNDHLRGSKHKSNCESLKPRELNAKDTGSLNSAKGKLKQGNLDPGTYAKETTPIEASAKNCFQETTPIKEVQQEWACDLCKVKTTSEKTLNHHLRGRKHMSKCNSLKASGWV